MGKVLHRITRGIGVLGLCLSAGLACAQTFPNRPGKIIVPFAAGGPMDIMARLVAHSLEVKLGQPFIVENRGGGGGTIGTRAGMAAEPDGYTLVWGTSGNIAAAAELYRTRNYDPSSLMPVAFVAKLPHMMVINNDVPAKTVPELVAFLKKNPNKYNYAGSLGAAPHLMGALFKAKADVDIAFIPYAGAAPAIADMLGGRAHILFDAITILQPLVVAEKVRGLGIVDRTRWHGLPDVPTMAEAGFPDLTMIAFAGLFAPAGTSKDIISKINAAVNEGLSSEEAKTTLDKIAASPQPGSPQDFEKFLVGEVPKWQELVRISGAVPE